MDYDGPHLITDKSGPQATLVSFIYSVVQISWLEAAADSGVTGADR